MILEEEVKVGDVVSANINSAHLFKNMESTFVVGEVSPSKKPVKRKM